MRTESQASLLERHRSWSARIESAFPYADGQDLRQQRWRDCAGQSCPRFICMYSWSLEMQSLLGTVS